MAEMDRWTATFFSLTQRLFQAYKVCLRDLFSVSLDSCNVCKHLSVCRTTSGEINRLNPPKHTHTHIKLFTFALPYHSSAEHNPSFLRSRRKQLYLRQMLSNVLLTHYVSLKRAAIHFIRSMY